MSGLTRIASPHNVEMINEISSFGPTTSAPSSIDKGENGPRTVAGTLLFFRRCRSSHLQRDWRLTFPVPTKRKVHM